VRLSNKAIYALRALFHLGYHGGGKPVQLKDVAGREAIPTRFLEQIFGELKRGDLVRSKRGPGGGYMLARKPEAISVRDVFEAIEELPTIPDVDEPEDEAIADIVCGELLDEVCESFENVTLADLLQRGDDAGIRRASYEDFVYVI
jgi:Rrf2 family protein